MSAYSGRANNRRTQVSLPSLESFRYILPRLKCRWQELDLPSGVWEYARRSKICGRRKTGLDFRITSVNSTDIIGSVYGGTTRRTAGAVTLVSLRRCQFARISSVPSFRNSDLDECKIAESLIDQAPIHTSRKCMVRRLTAREKRRVDRQICANVFGLW
jgi:hypothetical protein